MVWPLIWDVFGSGVVFGFVFVILDLYIVFVISAGCAMCIGPDTCRVIVHTIYFLGGSMYRNTVLF